MAEERRPERRIETETYVINPKDYVSAVRRTSWGAVIAGVFAAMAMQLLFTALGSAIGLSAAYAALNHDGEGEAFGWGVGLWWLLTGVVSLFIGGWVAGRLSGVIRARDGMLHGFVMWGVTAMIGLYLTTTAMGLFVGGASAAVHDELMAGPDTAPAHVGYGESGATTAPSGDLRGELEELRQNPREAARRATGYLVGASWWTFLGLLLGAISAAVGGWVGTPRSPTTEIEATISRERER